MKIFNSLCSASLLVLTIMLISCHSNRPATITQTKIKEINPNLADITFKVEGMDSLSVNKVQDALSATEGITRNFACWTDTVVFIEYDMLLITKQKIIEIIKSTGFTASEKKNE